MSTTATAVTVATNIKQLIKLYKKLKAYLNDDYEAWLSLGEPVYIKYTGKDIGKYAPFESSDGRLRLQTNEAKNVLEVFIKDFEWWLKMWNGISVLPDTDDGGYDASLLHDLVDHYLEEYTDAMQLLYPDIPRKKLRREIRLHFDKILVLTWRHVAAVKGKNKTWIKFKTWAILQLLYIAPRDAWSKAMRILFIVTMLSTINGCAKVDPTWEVEHIDPVEFDDSRPPQGEQNEVLHSM